MKASDYYKPLVERFTMTIIEKHRTEYKLIDQVMNELTQVMHKIESLEVSAEENRIITDELNKSVLMYRKAIEKLPHRMSLKDTNLAYVFCNEVFGQDLNIKPDEIPGKSDYDIFPTELAEKIISEEKEILRSGVKREMEEKYVVSGQELTVLATKNPVRDDNGDIIGLQVVLQDITEDKRRAESHAIQFKHLEDLIVQAEEINNTLKIDLEKMTAQRNQLQADIKDLQESMTRQMALRDAESEKMKEDLRRETAERKEAVERLRKSFTQIQDLMNSVQSLMGSSDSEAK
jgi:PAS domain S-box-containing protein